DWKKVHAPIPVLREITDEILTPISSTSDEEVFRVREIVEAHHPHSRFHIASSNLMLDLDGKRLRETLDKRIQSQVNSSDVEVIRNLASVPRVDAVSHSLFEHEDPCHFLGSKGPNAESSCQRTVSSASETYHEAC